MKEKWIFIRPAAQCTFLSLLIPTYLPGPQLLAQLKAPDATRVASSQHQKKPWPPLWWRSDSDMAIIAWSQSWNPGWIRLDWRRLLALPPLLDSDDAYWTLDTGSSSPSSCSLPIKTGKSAPHRGHIEQQRQLLVISLPRNCQQTIPWHWGSTWFVQSFPPDKAVTGHKAGSGGGIQPFYLLPSLSHFLFSCSFFPEIAPPPPINSI